MRYEIKSILKSKICLVCFLVFIIINMFSMNFLNLENSLEGNIISNEQIIAETQSSISSFNNITKKLGKKITPLQIKIIDNYKKYLTWKIEYTKEINNYIKEHGTKVFDKTIEFEIWIQVFEMDSLAKNDKQLSQHVFKDELSELNPPNITFNPTMLNDMQKILKNSYEDAYHQAYNNVQNLLHELKLGNANKGMNLYKGPWSYLSHQLRLGSVFSFMVLPIGLFYTLIIMWQQKQNRSFDLSFLNTKNQKRFICSKFLNILISYLLILSISLFIPILILGFRYGFAGLDSYMLIDWGNFTSFEPNINTYYAHGWIQSLFSEYLTSVNNTMPIEMVNTLVFIPLVLSLILGIMKIGFIIILGLLISFFTKKQWTCYALGLCVIIMYIYSQQISIFPPLYPMFNPLSISSSLTVIVGNGTQTSLNVILLLMSWSIFIYICVIFIVKRKDLT